MQTVVSLVSAEMGVALIPRSLQNLQRTGVIYKPLKDISPMSEIHLAWRRNDKLPALQLFLQLARDIAATDGAKPPKKAAKRR